MDLREINIFATEASILPSALAVSWRFHQPPSSVRTAIKGGVNDKEGIEDTDRTLELQPTADGGIDTSNTLNLYFKAKVVDKDSLNIDNIEKDTNNNNTNTHTKTVPDDDVAVAEAYPNSVTPVIILTCHELNTFEVLITIGRKRSATYKVKPIRGRIQRIEHYCNGPNSARKRG